MKAGVLVASKYRLVTRLGQGGMGVVWSAANVQTGKEFAIKFLHPLIASSSDDARQRFLQEARASARVNHPNIIDIFDVGETDDGSLFLVMELLEGLSLQDALRSDPPFSARELLVIAAGCATALGAAHAAGIVHRDVKPPNIFLCRDRSTQLVRPKILDFGVSKVAFGDDGIATHTGSLLGSPRYMSPEQAISASQADGRADIWSLGVILYEGLTGTFPHDGDNSNAIVIAIAMKPPRSVTEVAPYLPLPLRELIDDCLKPIATRIQSMQIFVERLLAVLEAYDLSDVPLARASNAKKIVARPENFVIQTASGSQPGLSAMLAGQSASGVFGTPRAALASLAAVPPPPSEAPPLVPSKTEIIELPVKSAPRPAPPPVPPAAPEDEDATMVRVDPRALTTPMPPPAGGAEPAPVSASEPAVAPVSENQKPQVIPDPAESISSINVARGVPFGSVPPAQLQPLLSEPPSRPSRSQQPLMVAIAVLAAIGVAAIIAIVVLSRGPSEPAAAGSPVRTAESPPTAKASAAPTALSLASVAVSATGSALSSAKPSAIAAQPTGSAKAKLVGQPAQPKPTAAADPLRDLGSGIKISPKK